MITTKSPDQLAREDLNMKDRAMVQNYKLDDPIWDENCELEKLQPKHPWIRTVDLERSDARRKALEDAARLIEGFHTNTLYRKVLRKGAKLIREMKDAEPVKILPGK